MPGPDFFRQLGLFVSPDFLDPDSTAELCRQIAAAPAEKGTVVGRTGEQRLDEETRKVETGILAKEIRSPLKQRLRELMPELGRHFNLQLAGCEPPQCLMYRPGDFFKPHTDRGYSESVRRRLISAVIFLNRNSPEPAEGAYSGGELTFYGLLEGQQWEKCAFALNPEPGLLIAFPSDKWHEVKPVSHGQRFTVVTWFYGPDEPTLEVEPEAKPEEDAA